MLQFPAFTPCLMWCAPFCLHDSSSGAAMQIKLMFEQLVKRGVRVHVLSALIFDSPNGSAPFANLDEQLEAQPDAKWFDLVDNGVTYKYYKAKTRQINEITRAEETDFFQMFYSSLHDIKPDAIYLFGGSALEIAIMAESKRRGIKVISGVHNGNYANYNFPYSDLVLTDAKLTVQNYYKNSRINMMPTGTFIDPQKVIVKEKIEQKYITLMNPSAVKGVSIFMRLALMAKKKHPDWKFLIVESRGTWAQAVQIYKQKPAQFSNVFVAKHTMDVCTIYRETKLILMPSLWYEGFGRVAAEAILNAIPVLSSMSGGLPEAVNGGGVCLNAPKKCVEEYNYFPKAEECKEWYEKLEEMMDDKNYSDWQEKAKTASLAHDLEKNTDLLLSYIIPLLSSRPSMHPQYNIK